jgi:polyketide cyclase/dehydrase/lipid transport protein
MWKAQHVTQSIARIPAEVVAFAGDPRHLPEWASGLSSGIRKHDDEWVTDSPMGEVIVRFAPANEFGVLDHDVVMPDGTTFHNPLRVLPNGDGSEVVFTLFRLDGVTDAELEADAVTIRADLERLRAVLES